MSSPTGESDAVPSSDQPTIVSSAGRRDFLAGMAGIAGAASLFADVRESAGGDVSSMNNVPDPLLAEEELPTFRFALEKSEGRTQDGGVAKEATVKQLPISKGIAGVSMRLEPGVMRELHWHATAAEWAFVVSGRVRTTVVDPQGRSETNDFQPGDIWYFPRGHGHMLQCLGNEPCFFILVFDNGYFSEFGTFSVSDWMGHVPTRVLAKNLRVPESTFQAFPRQEVYFAKGPVPLEPAAQPRQGLKPPPSPTATRSSHRRRCTRSLVAANGGPKRRTSQSRRQSRGWCSNWRRPPSASFIGTQTPTSGTISCPAACA